MGSFLHFHLELIAGLTKLPFNAASNGAEPYDQRREGYENNNPRYVGNREIKAVKWLQEKKVQANAGEHNRQDGGSHSGLPGGDGHREQEQRELHAAEFIVL